MSGVFSIASYSVLQYLPSVTSQAQGGCAHFLFSTAISRPSFLQTLGQLRVGPKVSSSASLNLRAALSFHLLLCSRPRTVSLGLRWRSFHAMIRSNRAAIQWWPDHRKQGTRPRL